MPNWCANSATIQFPTTEMADDFKTRLLAMSINPDAKDPNGNDLSVLGWFIPEPKYDDSDEGMPGWYMWRVNNWGTKWDIQLHDDQWIDENTVVLHFDTAWSPPIACYESMDESGFIVNASYYEPGMCFTGYFENGEDRGVDYSDCETPEAVRDLVGDDLDDEWNISEQMREWMEEQAEYEAENDSGVESYG